MQRGDWVPDLLTHALIGYIVGSVSSWAWDRVEPVHVTACMVGAVLPDVSKLVLLFPNRAIERVLGVPFTWGVLHTAGGVTILLLIGITLTTAADRRPVGVLAFVGATTHLLADSLLATPTGYVGKDYLWPLTRFRPPTPGIYTATDLWPLILVSVVALAVYIADSRWASE